MNCKKTMIIFYTESVFLCACNLNMYNKFDRWLEEVSATLKFSDDECFLAFGGG